MEIKTSEQTFSFLNVQFQRFINTKSHNIGTNWFKILNYSRIWRCKAIPDLCILQLLKSKMKTFDSAICIVVCDNATAENVFSSNGKKCYWKIWYQWKHVSSAILSTNMHYNYWSVGIYMLTTCFYANTIRISITWKINSQIQIPQYYKPILFFLNAQHTPRIFASLTHIRVTPHTLTIDCTNNYYLGVW